MKTLQQNGLAERMNTPLTKRERCLWLKDGLSKCLWAKDVNKACYFINRSPCAYLDKMVVEEVWTCNLIDLDNLRILSI